MRATIYSLSKVLAKDLAQIFQLIVFLLDPADYTLANEILQICQMGFREGRVWELATSLLTVLRFADMDIFAFIHTLDPTKVKVLERERYEDEPRLLETTVDRTLPLLLVSPDCGESELEASVDKLFDEGGSGTQAEQGDSASGGGGPGGKYKSAVQRLFFEAVHNAKVRGDPIPTLPFVISSVSATPEHEGKGHTDSLTELNLRTISAPRRFVISSDSSHHSGVNIAEAEVDSFARPSVLVITATTTVTLTADPAIVIKQKIVKPSLFFANSTSTGGTNLVMGCFMDLSSSDFLFGDIRTVISHDMNLQKVYVPQWSVTNRSCLDDGRVCHKMVDEFPPNFFASIYEIEHDLLFIEFNVGATRRISLSAELPIEVTEKSLRDEVNALNGHNTILEKECNALDVKVTDLEATVASKERELIDSNAQFTRIKSQNDDLVDQVSSSDLKEKLSNYDNLTERLEEFEDAQLKVVNDKFDKLYTDFVEVTLHLEEMFYPYLLTTIAGRRWLLTHRMKLAISKCLNSPGYLSALGTTVSKAIEKGMQDGLAVGITHGMKGRAFTDIAAHNPFAKADYVSALQQLHSVNFPLLAELKMNKDASIEALMIIMHLEEHLAERLGLNESQPHADQLMVPIHHSPDKTVIGASALSLALDVSDARVWRIRENIMSHRTL
nr:hypothetical protein [Tanacetum cinerariifolium]